MENQTNQDQAKKIKSVLVRNVTNHPGYIKQGGRVRNIVIATLRAKPSEPEISIAAGQLIDLTIYGEEKVKNNAEIKYFIKMGCLKMLDEYPVISDAQKEEIKESTQKTDIEKQIADIQGSTNMSELEDMTNDDSLPMEVKYAALKQLSSLDGDTEPAPELKNNPGQNNIIA